jgi:hypothetical protein
MKRTLSSAALILSILWPLGVQADPERKPDERPAPRRPPLVWVNGEGGFQSLNLRTFEANEDTLTVGVIPTMASGPALGLAAGVRLSIFTLGARLRGALFYDNSATRSVGEWQMWTLGGEAGLRIPIGPVEPHILLGGGYASLGSVDDAILGLRDGLDVDGAHLRAGGGVDVNVTRHFTLGALGTADLLVLSRPGVPLRDLAEAQRVGTLNEAKARLLEADGSSVGSALSIMAIAGFRF